MINITLLSTPTLYNAGSIRDNLLVVPFNCEMIVLRVFMICLRTVPISKHAGGIGLSVHNIRAKDSHIVGQMVYQMD